uniref:Uncharacterized protein n=1 Tax=Solanum tuberosum TaxID=4113 RepID=M1E194_SOLTU
MVKVGLRRLIGDSPIFSVDRLPLSSIQLICTVTSGSLSRERRRLPRYALCSFGLPICSHLHCESCNFGRSRLSLRSHSAIHRMLTPIAKLVLPQGWHTGTLGELKSHSAVHRVVFAITRITFLHIFSLFCSFLPVSVLTLLLSSHT